MLFIHLGPPEPVASSSRNSPSSSRRTPETGFRLVGGNAPPSMAPGRRIAPEDHGKLRLIAESYGPSAGGHRRVSPHDEYLAKVFALSEPIMKICTW